MHLSTRQRRKSFATNTNQYGMSSHLFGAFIQTPLPLTVRSKPLIQKCCTTQMSEKRAQPARPSWLRIAVIAAGAVVGTNFTPRSPDHNQMTVSPSQIIRVDSTHAAERTAGDPIPLRALGIKPEDFLSERELRRPKTTQFSEAEQEIMELEEWEVHTQDFRNYQAMWAAIASVMGIFVLYKAGVMWENWIREQERKDMAEEIELTGTFIDPRAVRKDEDDESEGPSKGKGGKDKGKDPTGSGEGDKDVTQNDLDSLEKLFGKS